ncbi:MAG: hypothetical protein R3C56_35725 [Pirellulaceae bacterium]
MRNRTLWMLALAWTMNCVVSGLSPTLLAQSNSSRIVQIPVLLQGEEIKLPEDFVARLDGNQLKVALKTMGLTQKYPDRELLVTLIQDNGGKSELPRCKWRTRLQQCQRGAGIHCGRQRSNGICGHGSVCDPLGRQQRRRHSKSQLPPVAINEIRNGVESAGHGPTNGAAMKQGAAMSLSDYVTAPANRFQVQLRSDGTLKGQVIVPQIGYGVWSAPST